jgi:hypothetical protein
MLDTITFLPTWSFRGDIQTMISFYLLNTKIFHIFYQGNSAVRLPRGDEVLHCKIPFGNKEEPEEQKMSDFSDWGSTGSAEEIQVMDDSGPVITFSRYFICNSLINLFSKDSIS